MKKAVFSLAFIGLFSWFGLFADEPANDRGDSQRAVVVKKPLEW